MRLQQADLPVGCSTIRPSAWKCLGDLLQRVECYRRTHNLTVTRQKRPHCSYHHIRYHQIIRCSCKSAPSGNCSCKSAHARNCSCAHTRGNCSCKSAHARQRLKREVRSYLNAPWLNRVLRRCLNAPCTSVWTKSP